jgi:hypothetical protein
MSPKNGDPNGTRTRVFAVKGRRPRPLDDGAKMAWRRADSRDLSVVNPRKSLSPTFFAKP